MKDKVQEFINKTLKEESVIWLGIAKEKAKQYPNESLRQIIIRTVVQNFESKYPVLMEEFDNEVKKKRELTKNEYSADKDSDIRQLSVIPDGLTTRIDQAFKQRDWPRFMSKEAQKEYQEMDWFLKEFPRYKVPERY